MTFTLSVFCEDCEEDVSILNGVDSEAGIAFRLKAVMESHVCQEYEDED